MGQAIKRLNREGDIAPRLSSETKPTCILIIGNESVHKGRIVLSQGDVYRGGHSIRQGLVFQACDRDIRDDVDAKAILIKGKQAGCRR